eukprot:Gb_35387 [translate_table: standard]
MHPGSHHGKCTRVKISLLNQIFASTTAMAEAFYGPSSDVVVLTASNFKSSALAPIWENAATVLKAFVTVAALDVDTHRSLAQACFLSLFSMSIYVWAAAGKQSALEKAVGVGGYGYPAIVALNIEKSVYAPLLSAFELEHVLEFVKDAGWGGRGTFPLESVPVLEKTVPWDGKDGEILEEDEFTFDEL